LRFTDWDLAIALDLPEMIGYETLFPKLLGAKTILKPGPNGVISRNSQGKSWKMPRVSDQLIDILYPLAIALPNLGQWSTDININPQEVLEVDIWLQRINAGNAPKPWIAVAPWTNMPAKQWPTERFTEVGLRLQRAVGGTPFVFGGNQDKDATHKLIQSWGFGVPVSGSLNVRQGIALLKKCQLFIGNDCGTMHMAASAGINCVAIFSCRDQVGLWEPYGSGHVVLRTSVPCEGCMLRACKLHDSKCLKAISVAEVLNASLAIIRASAPSDNVSQ
jgi:ADP-heptose:LPS heptosyltransferase